MDLFSIGFSARGIADGTSERERERKRKREREIERKSDEAIEERGWHKY